MTQEDKNNIALIVNREFEKRYGKDDARLKSMMNDVAGYTVALALEHLDDRFMIISDGFKTTNARFDRLIHVLTHKDVIEEGLF